jgi:hypothetical protein
MERPDAVAAEFRRMVTAPEQSYDRREPAAVSLGPGNEPQAIPVM